MIQKLSKYLAAALAVATLLAIVAAPQAHAQTGGPVVTIAGKSQFAVPAVSSFVNSTGSGVTVVTSTTALPTRGGFLNSTGSSTVSVSSTSGLPTISTGATYSYISSTGTTAITSANILDRILIGTAGTADSSITLKDGTNAFATVSTSAQASLPLGVTVTTGSLSVISSGTTGAKLTVSYRTTQ